MCTIENVSNLKPINSRLTAYKIPYIAFCASEATHSNARIDFDSFVDENKKMKTPVKIEKVHSAPRLPNQRPLISTRPAAISDPGRPTTAWIV